MDELMMVYAYYPWVVSHVNGLFGRISLSLLKGRRLPIVSRHP
jgi:hypothetical protein